MIKKIVFSLGSVLLLTMASLSPVWAVSPIQFGVKVGLQGQGMTLNHNEVFDMLSTKGELGYNVGLVSRVSLGPVYLQPELVYGSNTFKMNGPTQTSAKFAVKNLEVPVLLGFKFLFIRVMAGPTFNLLNETKVKSGGNLPESFNTDVHKSAVGFQLGAGVEFFGLNLDFRYGGQFKRPYQIITYGDQMDQIKSSINAWQINLSYFF